MRKRRTREHVIADLGINHVERHVLRCGWTVERIRHDYGIDLMMRTFSETGEAETSAVYIQVKSTDSLSRSADSRTIPFRVQWRDLLFWVNEPLPVILVIYDAPADRAHWLHIQQYFRGRTWRTRPANAATVTLHITADNVLDESAVRLFAQFRDDELANP